MAQPAQKRKRRGVILSTWGWQRLQDVQEQLAITQNGGYAYTLEQLSELTGLSVRSIGRLQSCKVAVDRQTLEEFFGAFNLTLTEQDYLQPEATAEQQLPAHVIAQDWGEAPDVCLFYGRTAELTSLTQWILQERCRLIEIIGIGGIGKTVLSVKLAAQVQDHFTYVIWRSLRHAPPLETLLTDLILFLSNQQDTQVGISRLLHWLRTARCLVILDHLEALLDAERAGEFSTGYENYAELLQMVAETPHQSCVVFTSREKPAVIAPFEGEELMVRSLRLVGLQSEAVSLLNATGLIGSDTDKQRLVDNYGGNPLALKIVATSIRDLFDADLGEFLAQDTILFNGVRRMLDQQFGRLSTLEQSIMYWLAINQVWTSIVELQNDIVPAISKIKLLEALEALTWRNLIEKRSGAYTQQLVVMEYVTDRLIDMLQNRLKIK